MNSDNNKNVSIILEQSFRQMLMSMKAQQVLVNFVEKKRIQDCDFKTVICSIAAATFKINVLLHFSTGKLAMSHIGQINSVEANESKLQHFTDYISEHMNNLCGAANRIVGACGFFSGMSTPVHLHIPNSALHMDSIAPSSETHIGCFFNGEPLLFASLYLFVNAGFEDKLVLKVPELCSAAESSGELEMF